jgi:hypothetical protein
MKLSTTRDVLCSNSYPGRGIITGLSEDGKTAVCAYFIMGRSENSRNRVFEETEDGIRTRAFDESKLEDPSLIIYSPARTYGQNIIVTNGDQTDTIYDGLKSGLTFEQSLRSRTFEPDGPNYTPRISSCMNFEGGYSIEMSILKSNEGCPDCTDRYNFYYDKPIAGEGRFIHTYIGDGNPLPSFEGEPERVIIKGDIDEFTNEIWDALNTDNKISLYTVFVDIASMKKETRIINKNK